MSSSDRFLSLFFEEARELLQALESGLMDLEARQDDREHVDRTFRAAHTLKGAAGMVGLRAVSAFTHKVEAVLDMIRGGKLPVTSDAITVLLRARDHLGAAVDAAVEGNALDDPPDVVDALIALAEGRTPERVSPNPEPAEQGGMVESESEPIAAGSAIEPEPTPVESSHTWRVTLRPTEDTLRKGVNPVGFLDELRELGAAQVLAVLDRLPTLDEIDPTACYLAWQIDLVTEAGRKGIDDVFLFLDDPSQVDVESLAGQGGEPAALESAIASGFLEAVAPPTAAAPNPEPAKPRPVLSPRVRVDADQLDQLVGMAGELAVLTDSLQGLIDLPAAARWTEALEGIERLGRLLRDATLELRMVAVEELFSRFPRVVRDLAGRSGKRIDLVIEGADTQLDRSIIEKLADPMIHLIRNAIDHGLETPDERQAAGKPPTGKITIAAGHEGDRVAIRISDDGRGLDRAKILKKGVRLGLLPADTPIDDPRVGNLIFEAGFSTREQVGELSGRGVGLDVVRDAIRTLRGTVSLRSKRGKGTTFLIRLPLTLAMIDGLLVEDNGGCYVVPIGQVDECVSLMPGDQTRTMGRPAAVVRGELVPIVPLHQDDGDDDDRPRRELLLTRYAEQRVAVAVDRLLGRVQTVIQPLDPSLGRKLGRYSGATILGDGTVSLILDLGSLVAEARAADLGHRRHHPTTEVQPITPA